MGIDFDVALRMHRQIEQTVAAESVEHMIEKRHARRNVADARTVKVELYYDVGFARFARNLSNSSHGQLLSKRLESTLYQLNDSYEPKRRCGQRLFGVRRWSFRHAEACRTQAGMPIRGTNQFRLSATRPTPPTLRRFLRACQP